MRVFLLVSMLFSNSLWAARSSVEVSRDIPAYEAPAPGSKMTFSIHAGETVSFAPVPGGSDYYHVWVKRSGKWRVGFVEKWALNEGTLDLDSLRIWGVGGGVAYTSLSQKGKTFETEDQVQYTTTEYKSSSQISPFATFQLGVKDFWRLSVAYKTTNYKTTAKTNLIGSVFKDVTLQQTFVSALAEKAWNPLPWKPLYLGIGAEVAKAMAVKLTMGGVDVPTTSQDQPVYLGGLVEAGVQFFVTRKLSVFTEARYEMVLNQSPAINGLEFSAALMYWP